MTKLRLWGAAWLVGLLAYAAGLALLYGQTISARDLRAVAVVSAIAFTPCYWLVYLPILRIVRRVAPRPSLGTAGAVVATLLGVAPTLGGAWLRGGSFAAAVGPEPILFAIVFTALGVVLGFGFAALPDPLPDPPPDPDA